MRELEVRRLDALLGTATLAVYPIFALLSATFMTDVPFLSMTIVASAAMVKAMRVGSTRWLWGAVFVASLAVGIRAVGVVMPIAMLLSLVLARDGWGRQKARWLVTLTPLVVFGVLYALRSQVFHGGETGWLRGTMPDRLTLLREFALPLLPRMLAETFALAIGVLGVALLPLTIACFRNKVLRTLSIAIGIGAALAGLYALGIRYPLPLTPELIWSFHELGGSSMLVPDHSRTPFSPWLSWIVLAIATVSIAAAVNEIWQRRARQKGESFLLWSLAGHAGIIALIWLVYDRYALILVPYAITLLLVARPRLSVPAAVGTLAIVATMTTIGIRDHLSYNTALWDAVESLEQRGVPEREINGGYMVNGWLQYAHPERARRTPQGQVDVPWVSAKGDRQYKISNRASAGWTELKRFPYQRWLGSSGSIYALKVLPAPEKATAARPRDAAKATRPAAALTARPPAVSGTRLPTLKPPLPPRRLMK
jgi:Dolichyl-phosphate-mannose-protein mannosyltransferase